MLTDALEGADGESFGNNPKTKAEQPRWEDAIQKGKVVELGGKSKL